MKALLAALALTTTLFAQAPAPKTSTPQADALHDYNALKKNILKAADNMPADAYAFRPTPDIRTFARVVNHISEAQLRFCGLMNGTAPTALAKVPAETAPKAEIVAALQTSYAECDKAYSSITDANMLDTFAVFGSSRSRISLAFANVSHDNEQYATLALYMRLKGLVPPSSEK